MMAGARKQNHATGGEISRSMGLNVGNLAAGGFDGAAANADPIGSPAAIEARNEMIRKLHALPRCVRPTLAEIAERHNLSYQRVQQIVRGRPVDSRAGMKSIQLDGAGSIRLVLGTDGRSFEAFHHPAGGAERRHLGAVEGSRGNWRATIAGSGQPVRATSLRALAQGLVRAAGVAPTDDGDKA